MILPIPVGSIPYSAGITTVTSNTAAVAAARTVDFKSFLDEGSSRSIGMFVLYME